MPERDHVTAFRLAEDAAFARYGVTVAEHSLDVGGRTVRVLESGDGPPIVLVPGDGAVAGAWAPLVPELPGYRTIVLDRPGAGLSGPSTGRRRPSRSGGRAADGLARRARSRARADRRQLRWRRVGALDGDRLTGARQRRRGARHARVSLPGVRPQPPMRLLSVPGLGQLLARIPAPSPDATGRMLAKTDARLPEHPEIVALYHAAGRLPGYAGSVAALFQASMRPGGRPRATCVIGDDELQALDVPVLFVFGADEPLGGPEVVRRALRVAIAGDACDFSVAFEDPMADQSLRSTTFR